MKIDRLLAITVMLLNRRRATARELADHFAVSVRTIYRDIESINAAGIPIVSYQGHEGGFCIMDNYKLNRQLLTFQDMLSILTALKGVNTTLRDRDLHNAIEKIQSLIPDEKEPDYARHADQFVMEILPWGCGDLQQERIQKIYASIAESKQLSFTYRDMKRHVSRRTVEPMTLVFKPPGWYLFAFCLKRNDYRVFKLSRMREVRPLEQTFTRKETTYHQFFAPDYDKRPTVAITLKFYPPLSQSLDEWFQEKPRYHPDGSAIIVFTMPADEWVYSLILSFGEYVEVLSPAHIREKVAAKTKKMVDRYTNLT